LNLDSKKRLSEMPKKKLSERKNLLRRQSKIKLLMLPNQKIKLMRKRRIENLFVSICVLKAFHL